MKTRNPLIFSIILVCVIVAQPLLSTSISSRTVAHANSRASQSAANTSQFKGVNWADARDNYIDGWVIPTGLSASDNYDAVQTKADQILGGFQRNLGANTVRLPINPPSVAESWWDSYTGAIDMASSKGMKVILSYWEANKDGKIDDLLQYWSMWEKVVNRYGSNGNIYFELMNEPYGYTSTEWTDLAAEWLSNYSIVPPGRVIVSGTGYNDNLSAVGSDTRLKNCLLSLHIYPYWGKYKTEAEWRQDLTNRLAGYQGRAIVDEFGVALLTEDDKPIDFSGPINSEDMAFMYGVLNQIHDYDMGAIYWPGLRKDDRYSMEKLNNSGTISNINETASHRLRWAWNLETTPPPTQIISRFSNKCADIENQSSENGAMLQQSECSGNLPTQQWFLKPTRIYDLYFIPRDYYQIISIKSGKCLEVYNWSTANQAEVDQWDCHGGRNQLWRLDRLNPLGYYQIVNVNTIGFLGLTNKCLDVSGWSQDDGAQIWQYSCNGNSNQQWRFSSPVMPQNTAFNFRMTIHILPGETVRVPVEIAADQPHATFATSWFGSDFVMSLTTPSGRVIDRNTNAPDVLHGLTPTSETYTMLTPEAGTWEVSLFGAVVEEGGEDVLFELITDTQAPLPELAYVDGSTLVLNMGSAERREARHILTDEINEDFTVKQLSPDSFSVSAFGLTRVYTGASKVKADGDDGNDTIALEAGSVPFAAPAEITGGAGDDKIVSGDGADMLSGGPGADQINAGGGADTISGDEGPDIINGGDGNDTISGGADADILHGDNGNDSIHGDDGDDKIYGDAGNDQLNGGNGNDQLEGNDGDDIMHGDAGDDTMHGGAGADEMYGDAGQDQIYGESGDDRVDGGAGNDYLEGNADNDVMHGGEEDDRMYGNDGNDKMFGDAGRDLMWGNSGNDEMHGGDGDDYLEGNEGADDMWGDNDQDDMIGGNPLANTSDGADTMHGGSGSDVMVGDNASITRLLNSDGSWQVSRANGAVIRVVTLLDVEALANTVAPTVYAGDVMWGDDNDDVMYGQGGEDELHGGNGDDYIEGNAASDTIFGDAGDDDILGGSGPTTSNDPTTAIPGLVDASTRTRVVPLGSNPAATVPLGDVIDGGDDSDVILGDNGILTRPIDVTGHWITLNYSLFADTDGSAAPRHPINGTNSRIDRDVVLVDMTLDRTAGSDVISGGRGDDDIYGQFDDTNGPVQPAIGDELIGSEGEDAMVGDLGIIDNRVITSATQTIRPPEPFINDDILISGTLFRQVTLLQASIGGNDRMQGGPGSDWMHGGAGDDLMNGNSGNDRLFGDDGADAMWGGLHHDHLFGGNDEDSLDVKPRPAMQIGNGKKGAGQQISIPADPLEWSAIAGSENFQNIDYIYGGWDADEMQADVADTGPVPGDRLMDWVGAYNVFYLCPGLYGDYVVTRDHSPNIVKFLQALAAGDGAVDTVTLGSSGFNELTIVFPKDVQQNSHPRHLLNPGHFTCSASQ